MKFQNQKRKDEKMQGSDLQTGAAGQGLQGERFRQVGEITLQKTLGGQKSEQPLLSEPLSATGRGQMPAIPSSEIGAGLGKTGATQPTAGAITAAGKINGPADPSRSRPQSARPWQNSEWMRQVSEFVTQCFETFPQFGSDAGSLGTQIKSFTVGLEDYDLPEISYAFRLWLKKNKKMPLPADIGDIALEWLRDERKKLEPRLQRVNLVRKQEGRFPSWYGKSWGELSNQDREDLAGHLASIGNRAPEYVKYLVWHCGYPRDAFSDYRLRGGQEVGAR